MPSAREMTRHAETIRDVNRERILTALRDAGAASRAELEHATGLSRGTVASIVDDLLGEGVLRPQAVSRRTAKGRPPMRYGLASRVGLALVVDVGHRHVRVAVGDATGEIVAERFTPIAEDRGPEKTLSTARRMVAEVVAAGHEPQAVVLGLPTPVAASGRPATNTYSELDLADRIGVTGLPVLVMNDANLGALGESAFGAAHGLSDFIFLKMSGGVGAGIMLGGRLYRGSGGVAGDIAHVRVREAGDWCPCGNRGCLQTLVSLESLAATLRKSHPGLGNMEVPRILGSDDPDAERLVYTTGWVTGRALAGMVNLLNPGAIVVGGTLGAVGEPLLAGLRDSIRRYAQPSAATGLQVQQAQRGERAEVFGGLAVAFGLAGDPSGRVPTPAVI
jgi:predicted NBD/HSP70 family sugar kinase